jgi:hypothetical protein
MTPSSIVGGSPAVVYLIDAPAVEDASRIRCSPVAGSSNSSMDGAAVWVGGSAVEPGGAFGARVAAGKAVGTLVEPDVGRGFGGWPFAATSPERQKGHEERHENNRGQRQKLHGDHYIGGCRMYRTAFNVGPLAIATGRLPTDFPIFHF